MKKFAALLIFACLLFCGYLISASVGSKQTSESISVSSPLTMEAKDKRSVGTARKNKKTARTKKALTLQKKTLNKMETKDTITLDAKSIPEPSPREIHPSGQY